MKMLLSIPLLALFVPWGLDHVSRDLASHSSPSPSASPLERTVSPQPSRVETATTTPIHKKPPGAVVAKTTPALPMTTTPDPVSAPKPTTTPVSAATPSDFTTALEAEVLRLTNTERASEGLASLSANTKLGVVSDGHSLDMLTQDYFSHDDPSGCGSSCRATDGGYRWRAIGENIYMMSGYKITPEKAAEMVVEGWMNSPGHRANILSASFIESGVGVAYDGTSIYVTAMYGKQR